MISTRDHQALIRRGLTLHEARRYAAALPYFDRALQMAPRCPVAAFNRANTLHMLGRDRSAYPILRALADAGLDDLRQRRPDSNARSLQLDTYLLLFWVVLGDRGPCAEAFDYARKHLQRRKRGIQSVWSLREVRADIAAIRKQWSRSTRGRS